VHLAPPGGRFPLFRMTSRISCRPSLCDALQVRVVCSDGISGFSFVEGQDPQMEVWAGRDQSPGANSSRRFCTRARALVEHSNSCHACFDQAGLAKASWGLLVRLCIVGLGLLVAGSSHGFGQWPDASASGSGSLLRASRGGGDVGEWSDIRLRTLILHLRPRLWGFSSRIGVLTEDKAR
jgi:hypothetical protein